MKNVIVFLPGKLKCEMPGCKSIVYWHYFVQNEDAAGEGFAGEEHMPALASEFQLVALRQVWNIEALGVSQPNPPNYTGARIYR